MNQSQCTLVRNTKELGGKRHVLDNIIIDLPVAFEQAVDIKSKATSGTNGVVALSRDIVAEGCAWREGVEGGCREGPAPGRCIHQRRRSSRTQRRYDISRILAAPHPESKTHCSGIYCACSKLHTSPAKTRYWSIHSMDWRGKRTEKA